jgi:hypothetical protein
MKTTRAELPVARLASRLLAVLAAALALGCSTLVVDSKVERGSDLSRYRTFSLAQVDAPEDTVAVAPLEDSIARALGARGLSRVSKEGDLLVSAHFTFQPGPPDPALYAGTPIMEAAKLFLSVDAADPKANVSVWNASAHEQVPRQSTSADRQQAAEHLIASVFQKFPAGPKK